ncbi:hypothetical protein [Bradyrhizobium sp.]|uniref:hypothetical protein n=1 Tax=Bradyrhizobium sp. TaxID=376 RepID=UPI0039E6DD85
MPRRRTVFKPEPSDPFGPNTVIIEWTMDRLEFVQSAIDKGCPELEGVTLKLLQPPIDAARAKRNFGGAFVAVSMPEPLFQEFIDMYVATQGGGLVSMPVQLVIMGKAEAFFANDRCV